MMVEWNVRRLLAVNTRGTCLTPLFSELSWCGALKIRTATQSTVTRLSRGLPVMMPSLPARHLTRNGTERI